ncbi:MAG: methylenetetrahydrofolate reductase C-terminal domain-containing protein [Desulfobacterales bacterium]|nr:methylenetetrahydrofolate reductase C-terminal domain-containing protein [Desulfobacterales bacterium]
MIRSITQSKSEESLDGLLEGFNRIFILGCGTCVTLTRTGGEPEVVDMKARLEEKGKLVTGHAVVPVACDNLTRDILQEFGRQMEQAGALLVMTCAFGVQTVARQMKKPVIPALDTLFIGKETDAGLFDEICNQCGTCIIGETGGICPVTTCHKGLVNGPCGGTNHGMCEIDAAKDCAWTLIYNRLQSLGRLHSMGKYQKPRNHQAAPKPGKFIL